MKVISSHSANVVLRLPLDDIKPTVPYSPQTIIKAIAAKYGFSGGAPTVPPSIPTPGAGTPVLPVAAMGISMQPLLFLNGSAILDERTIGIAQLYLSIDLSQIIVTTDTTENGDLVADDILSILEADYKFREAKQRTLRTYGSSVIVEFERGLEDYISALTKIQELITPVCNQALQIDQPMKIERLTFGHDATLLPSSKVSGNFLIERRVGHPFSENRYFCGAPIRTTEHIRLLEEIERAIAAR